MKVFLTVKTQKKFQTTRTWSRRKTVRVSRSNWFCTLNTLRDWLRTLAPVFIQSEVKPKPNVTCSHAVSRTLHLRVLIGSQYYLCPLWLAEVITLVLVLWNSVESRSNTEVDIHNSRICLLGKGIMACGCNFSWSCKT